MGVDIEGGRGRKFFSVIFVCVLEENSLLARLVSFLSRRCGCIIRLWDPGND